MAKYSTRRRFYKLSESRNKFMHSPWAGGIVLLICAIIAIVCANLESTKVWYHHLWSLDFTIGFENFNLTKTVEEWINDGLMVIFFFVVGLEIKIEMIAGRLSTLKQASLPIVAAIGGMLFPAAIYAIFNNGTPAESGWGIPMATDIAFALGVLSLMGKRVPLSLKIFLTALAIVDDLGAILVIAIFYSQDINFEILAAAALTLGYLIFLNKTNVFKIKYYILPSILLWILFLHSGIHATIAGVIIAMTIPAKPRYGKKYFLNKSRSYLNHFLKDDKQGVEILSNEQQHHDLQLLNKVTKSTISPAQKLGYSLHHTVAFFIMPVFALANAGVEVNMSEASNFVNPQSLGIMAGLVVGKPLGIFLLCWMTIKLGWCGMPEGASWRTLLGVACLGGIGFTMSIFINNLAFGDVAMISVGKAAILAGSTVAALLGVVILRGSK